MKRGFGPKAIAFAQHRAQSFAKVTQRKGMPMTYGTGKPPEDKKR